MTNTQIMIEENNIIFISLNYICYKLVQAILFAHRNAHIYKYQTKILEVANFRLYNLEAIFYVLSIGCAIPYVDKYFIV